LLASFEEAATSDEPKVFQGRLLESCPTLEAADLLVKHARSRDIAIVPMADRDGVDREYVESLIFGSGRPVLVMPHTWKHRGIVPLDNVVVAWDSSRAAARAVADSIPILRKAKRVHVVTVVKEKELNQSSDIAKHLGLHGIDVVLDEVKADGRRIGEVLDTYCSSRKAEMRVMGAFGHSRTRDFVLGGATKSVLSRLSIPTLLSH
jgi:nucleotide-binding universal stress UspA family protein